MGLQIEVNTTTYILSEPVLVNYTLTQHRSILTVGKANSISIKHVASKYSKRTESLTPYYEAGGGGLNKIILITF